MTTPAIIGLDLSLTATGIAGNKTGGWADVIRPPAKMGGHGRLDWLRLTIICGYVTDVTDPYVVVEGPSYASTTGSFHERAGLWWLVTHDLWKRGIPYASVPPTTLKRYAVGKGNATKDAVLVAVTRRFPWCPADNNAADAATLAAMGADHFGAPMCDMPKANRGALDAVVWPPLSAVAE